MTLRFQLNPNLRLSNSLDNDLEAMTCAAKEKALVICSKRISALSGHNNDEQKRPIRRGATRKAGCQGINAKKGLLAGRSLGIVLASISK